MSELKDYDIMDIEAMDDERLEKSSSGKIFVTRVYIKDEVDAVLSEKDKEIAKLKEERRWRKCSEEMPPTDGSYMCAYKNKDDGVLGVDEAVWDGEKWSYKFDFWEDIIYWQFKPKAPEADK